MIFLHTSDWHLGKILHETSLIEDQKFFLNQLINHIEEQSKIEPYDALIIAGDIYDRSLPSVEAISLLSDFLFEINQKFPELHVFLISGNHDSAMRLSFCSEIFENLNIHITTNVQQSLKPIIVGKKDKVAVYQIPFLVPGCVSTEKEILRHQNELIGATCKKIFEFHKQNYSSLPSVVVSHSFVDFNSVEFSGSESSFLGTAECVDSKNFSNFNYVALGHIHKMQKIVEKKMFYSGSPIPYNFGESNDKYFLRVKVTDEQTVVEPIKINLLNSLLRIEGTFDDFLKYDSSKLENSYIEFVCTDNLEHQNALEILKSKFPKTISFRVKKTEYSGSNKTIEDRKKIIEKVTDDNYVCAFELFMKEIYGDENKELGSELYKKEKQFFESFVKSVMLEDCQ